jgi:hypothetical protein
LLEEKIPESGTKVRFNVTLGPLLIKVTKVALGLNVNVAGGVDESVGVHCRTVQKPCAHSKYSSGLTKLSTLPLGIYIPAAGVVLHPLSL